MKPHKAWFDQIGGKRYNSAKSEAWFDQIGGKRYNSAKSEQLTINALQAN